MSNIDANATANLAPGYVAPAIGLPSGASAMGCNDGAALVSRGRAYHAPRPALAPAALAPMAAPALVLICHGGAMAGGTYTFSSAAALDAFCRFWRICAGMATIAYAE